MRIFLILFAIFLITPQEDTSSIRNFLRINDQFCTGGQPRLEHLEKLRIYKINLIYRTIL